MRFDRVSALLELVRWQGRGLRGDPSAIRGLLESCYVALEVGLPEDFILSGLCILQQASERIGASSDSIKADFPRICEYGREVEKLNNEALRQIALKLEDLGVPTTEALLLGDPAVLLGLYRTTCAFRGHTWAVGVPGEALNYDDSITEHAVVGLPFDVVFGKLSRLQPIIKEHSEIIELGGARWRAAGPELLACFMAARVGEPAASPVSNTWTHLAAGVKAHRDALEVDRVLSVADELHMAERVHRGFAIVSVLFPELRVVIRPERLDIPAWEKVALRLAAHKLLREAVAEEA